MVASLGMVAMARSAEDILTASVRDYVESVDHNFIYNSWINSYRDYAPWAKADVPRATIYKRLRERIDNLLLRGCELKIACDPEDTNLILGWMCAEPPVLHYIYVKEAYRHQGIALTLMASVGLSSSNIIPCTHWTSYAELIAAKRPRLLRRVDLF
jgi:hypothetical protein